MHSRFVLWSFIATLAFSLSACDGGLDDMESACKAYLSRDFIAPEEAKFRLVKHVTKEEWDKINQHNAKKFNWDLNKESTKRTLSLGPSLHYSITARTKGGGFKKVTGKCVWQNGKLTTGPQGFSYLCDNEPNVIDSCAPKSMK